MDIKFKVFITLGILVLLVAGLYIFSDWFSKVTGYLTGQDEKIALIKCMNGKGVELYGSDYCAECERQRNLFGKSAELLNYFNCGSEDSISCIGLRSLPAWYIEGKIEYGYKDLNELKKLSGCLK